jgi:hypothetical protein
LEIAGLYWERRNLPMYGSPTLIEHLVRGGLGVTLFVLAAITAAEAPLLAVALALAALVPLRGCPVCWTVGLYETSCKRKPPTEIRQPPSETLHT